MEYQIKKRRYPTGLQFGFVAIFGILLAAIVSVAVVFAFQNKYAGKIYPGVTVGGIDLSNLSEGQAALKLREKYKYPETGRILLSDGDQKWIFSPNQLGLSVDLIATANAAYQYGRSSDMLTNLRQQLTARDAGYDLKPAMLYDEKAALTNLQQVASLIDKPVIEAAMGLAGSELQTNKGQVGREVNVTDALKQVNALLLNAQDGAIVLPVTEKQPLIMDVGSNADLARQILSAPLSMKMPENGPQIDPWVIDAEGLSKLLLINRSEINGQVSYNLSLNSNLLKNQLISLAPSVKKDPVNMRAVFNTETKQFEVLAPSAPGYSLDVDASAEAIQTAVLAGNHEATLVFKTDAPAVSETTDPASLGITELVAETTSYYYGSDPDRVTNIEVSAASFRGVFVPPYSVFSMGDYLKDISLENGYAEAMIIVGGQTVKGVGGGVCQVSTTLFREVFLAGFPIVERHAHAYRVGYYEQTANGYADPNNAGLDATVYLPLVDFKFRNDTPYWMVMDTEAKDFGLTWRIWSTHDGRTVETSSTGISDVKEPPADIYTENPSLSEGEIKQIDWAVAGATVNVTRTVYKDGKIYFTDTIDTTYQPWPNAFEYGPGTELPEDAKP